MSWSRGIQGQTGAGGAFVTLRTINATIDQPGAVPDPRADRLAAREAYQIGDLDRAGTLQARLIATLRDSDGLQAEDILFLGLVLTAKGQRQEAITAIRDGLSRFADVAAMHENLGVLLMETGSHAEAVIACERALELGSDSPNVLDCLTDAHARLGRTDLAVTWGRRALEAKDLRFRDGPRLVTLPPTAPPPFNAMNPAENVIAYGLWGNAPRYHVPLLENTRIRAHLFPAWRIRVYHGPDVDPGYLATLREREVELIPVTPAPDQPAHRRLLWRFQVASDPTVRRFLCRDADSLLTVKERVAVDAWLASDFPFHGMRDWYSHTDLLLAGMWGGVGGLLPPVEALLGAYRGWRVEYDHMDQDLLAETVWPIVRGRVLMHDSVFAPCLGSVPFPPFGALPPTMHIGQNAFVHFQRGE